MRLNMRGFNVVELMVAMVAGLLLIAAVTSLFAAILKANHTALQISRLNQEIQYITDSIARDIQRAGYDVSAAQHTLVSGASSPFYFDATTALMDETSTGSGLYTCLRVRYDNDDVGTAGVVDANEILTYSFSNADKGLKQGTGAATCGNGSLISTDNTIEITAATFRLLPSSKPEGARAIQLSVNGRFKANPALNLALQRDIKLRNDGY